MGWLDPCDVSLTYSASTGQVRAHQLGESDVVGSDIFQVLEEEIARDQGESVVWVGFFGYACRPDLPARQEPVRAATPDAVWMRLRLSNLMAARAPCGSPRDSVGRTARSRPPSSAYAEGFATVQRELRRGNSYEVNFTYRNLQHSTMPPPAAYLRLRSSNPAPYAGFLQHDGFHLLCTSPEQYAGIDQEGWIQTRPIKGTTPRGRTAVEDADARDLLATAASYRAENLMIVDLVRNDLSVICDPGTVEVPSLMAVESHPSVHQLVSTVRGRLRSHVSPVRALHTLFPAGSMTGAPKRRTMEVIAEIEETRRGAYAGSFGYVRPTEQADLCVIIRSLVAVPANDGWVYEFGTGSGITVYSNLQSEFEETLWKSHNLRLAIRPTTGSLGVGRATPCSGGS